MNINTIEYKKLGETVHVYEHETGLKAFVIPKKGYYKKYAIFGTNYGSINDKFILPDTEEELEVPDGIAHFLEHKLFEQEYGSVMNKFSELGSSPNAFTSFTETAYLFSCTDKFSENFQLLLDYVQTPYLTDESVEKEKGIIGQEIKMYEDNPGWRAFFNLLECLYIKHPAKKNIAGTVESISKIDKEILYKCYNAFYHPSNMVIIVVGDVDVESVFEQVEKSIKAKDKRKPVQRIFPEEGLHVNKDYIEEKLAVSTPIFQLGFKDFNDNKGKELLKREVAVKILLEMIFGKSSDLYSHLYNKGLINNSFSTDYTIEEDYAYSILGGETNSPHEVKENIVKEINNIKNTGLNKEDYERTRKALKGKFLRRLNSVESICYNFMLVYFKNATVFDYFEIYDSLTFEYINQVFMEHFDTDKMALSVIKPF